MLTWKLPTHEREDIEVYRFLNQGSDFGAHNKRERSYGADEVTFVLDGQQRLTSLLIGLKGTYEVRKKYARTGETQRLFLDLLRDGEKADDEGMVCYGFQFRSNSASSTRGSEWFDVSKIWRFQDKLPELLEETKTRLVRFHASDAELELALANLSRFHRVVFTDASLNYHVETEGGQERMLEIFVRANSGGEPLSKSDLLLSNLTVHWTGLNAREEIKNFVDELNEKLNRGTSSTLRKDPLRQDFVLKACLVLLDLPVAYRISTFNRNTCQHIESNWLDVKAALAQTVEATNWFGINGSTLTSANALVPVAYFLYRNPEVRLLSESKDDANKAEMIRRWLIMSLLNGVLGGSSDSMLTKMREKIKAHGENGRPFPVQQLDGAVREAKRIPSSDRESIKSILNLKYGKPLTQLAQTLLFDDRGWGVVPHDCDHIFPIDGFKHFPQYKDLANNFGNLTLLTRRENNEKRAAPFAEWICTREAGFLERHLIPQDTSLWKLESFPDFVRERERLTLDRLFTVLATPPANGEKAS